LAKKREVHRKPVTYNEHKIRRETKSRENVLVKSNGSVKRCICHVDHQPIRSHDDYRRKQDNFLGTTRHLTNSASTEESEQ